LHKVTKIPTYKPYSIKDSKWTHAENIAIYTPIFIAIQFQILQFITYPSMLCVLIQYIL
jgi:hypothetical protein